MTQPNATDPLEINFERIVKAAAMLVTADKARKQELRRAKAHGDALNARIVFSEAALAMGDLRDAVTERNRLMCD